MSKMSNLDLIFDEMITAGQKMIEAATALREIFSDTTPEKVAPVTNEKKYSFQEVRGIMASLAGKGKRLK